jgi:hypothetical protein
MAAASAATGFRTWLQDHHFGWLMPKRMRALTLGAMCAAGLVSTVGISGSTAASRARGDAQGRCRARRLALCAGAAAARASS